MRRGVNLVAAAFALTALSYGLARFAYGLLLPQIRDDLSLSVTAAGWVGGSAFAAYCVGIVAAFWGTTRFGPRTVVLGAALAATAGMVLVALATSAWPLGAGIALAGLSTGLTSPPLAAAVSARFQDHDRPKANGTINAGTAAGIVFSGMAALAAAGAWRELYLLFAAIGAAVTVWLWFSIPARASQRGHSFSLGTLKRPGLSPLCISAFLMGLASTAVWTFGADVLRAQYGFSNGEIAGVWIILGVAGISGSLTGVLTNRFGSHRIHGIALVAMAIGTLMLAMTSVAVPFAYGAMALFGGAYIVSSGTYLIQGIELLPDRPDLGLGVPFLLIALGQTAGTPLFGMVLAQAGTLAALTAFAAAGCAAIFIRPRRGSSSGALATGQ
ncbi:MFS transporter [Pseudomonas sp. Marseille-QA0892]